VELFAHLAAEHTGASVPKKTDFMDYWPALKIVLGVDFPQQSAMKRLNQARVGLKHQGISPSREDIRNLAEKTATFFDEASQLVFGTPFFTLSTTSLVLYQPEASRLRRAEELSAAGSLEEASCMCALAFSELLERFRAQHLDTGSYSPFPHLSRATSFNIAFMPPGWEANNRELARHFQEWGLAFAEIEPVLLMVAIGLEYREFVRFGRVMPYVDRMMDGSAIIGESSKSLPSEQDIRVATDFATEAGLRLQELDSSPPRHAGDHLFSIEPLYDVGMPRKNKPELKLSASLVQIGGGFEGWIFHDDVLARVSRHEKNRDEVLNYLEQYKKERVNQADAERRSSGRR
jgi:hypothetical protein